MKGRLFLVPTPIGNLADMTPRAVEVLSQADLIACEDTRTSRRLLDHFGITTPTTSYHDFSGERDRDRLLKRLEGGDDVALISDAGTPGISDPAYKLVHEARLAGVTVSALPGASSILPALTGCGLPCDRFRYMGFVPRKKGRQTFLQEALASEETSILLESPHRVLATLAFLAEAEPERMLGVAREISKVHEEFLRDTCAAVLVHFTENAIRGEFVLVLEGRAAAEKRLRKAENDNTHHEGVPY